MNKKGKMMLFKIMKWLYMQINAIYKNKTNNKNGKIINHEKRKEQKRCEI